MACISTNISHPSSSLSLLLLLLSSAIWQKVERNAAALHANYKRHTHSSREDREESSHSSSGFSSKPSSSTNKALAVGIGGWDNQYSSSVDMIVSSNSGPKVDGYKAPRDVALRSGTMYKDGVQVDPGTRVEEKDVLSMEAAVDRAIDRIEQRLKAGKGNGSGEVKGKGKAVVSARASASESASASTSSEDTKKPSERAQRGSGGPYVRLSSGAKDRIEVYAAGHDVHVKPQVVVKALEMVREPKVHTPHQVSRHASKSRLFFAPALSHLPTRIFFPLILSHI
jgi:hypothetical protein